MILECLLFGLSSAEVKDSNGSSLAGHACDLGASKPSSKFDDPEQTSFAGDGSGQFLRWRWTPSWPSHLGRACALGEP